MVPVVLFVFAALLAQASSGTAARTRYHAGKVTTEDREGYLRVVAQPCGSVVQLLVIQGERSLTRHFPASSDKQHACLPVKTDSMNRVSEMVTLMASIPVEEGKVNVAPTVVQQGYDRLYSDASDCEVGVHNDAEITCGDNAMVANHSEARVQFWQNDFDGNLFVDCQDGEAFYRVRSEHDNGAEDRKWRWDCRRVTDSWAECYETGYVNGFDQPFLAMCGGDFVMTGVRSYHDNGPEDRRWNFKCCRGHNFYTRNCFASDHINSMDGNMDYSQDEPVVFAGAYSFHDNGAEDRVWKIIRCQYLRCGAF